MGLIVAAQISRLGVVLDDKNESLWPSRPDSMNRFYKLVSTSPFLGHLISLMLSNLICSCLSV